MQLRGKLPQEAPALRFVWAQSGFLPRHHSIADWFHKGENELQGSPLPVLVTANIGDRIVPAGESRRVAEDAHFCGRYVELDGDGHAPARLNKADGEGARAVLEFFKGQSELKHN